MKSIHKISIVLLLASFVLSACGSNAPVEIDQEVKPTSPAPTATASPEPSPTQAPLELEIVEWGEYPYADLADPQNTDTHVEVLIHNPNDFPVRINSSEDELRLVNAAGEVVYTNPSSVFYIWEGSWMLPGETAALSACVCFETDGVEKQDWVSLELVAPLEVATDIAYTPDVEVTLGEFFSLGGDELGAQITLVNTSDQVLESFGVRVIARDLNGKYVGVAVYGNFVASFFESINIEPGASGGGIVVTEIDYVNEPLTYEVSAIGVLAEE